MSPRIILGAIGFFGGIASLLVTQFDASWGLFEITLVAILFNTTAISWHGILLAETARLSPADKVGTITGGVLAFTSIAMMCYPAVYGILLATSGSYRTGFIFAAIPSLLAFVIFMRRPIEGGWVNTITYVCSRGLTLRGAGITMLVALSGLVIGYLSYSR